MRLDELIYDGEYVSSEIELKSTINAVCYDSSRIEPDALLVIPNYKKVPTYYNIRPRAILCDTNATTPDGIPRIIVPDARRATAYAYARFYGTETNSMKMIGITGTNGKTSTSIFIKHGLEAAGLKIGLIGTGQILIGDRRITDNNYSMTSPDPWLLYPTLKQMSVEGCDVVVMEVSSHALALEKLGPIHFDYGIFTNMSMEHLDFHSSMESYYEAKRSLFSSCDTAIINIDDQYGKRLAKEITTKKITAGVLWRGDIYASNIENHGFDGISYLYHGKSFTFRMNLTSAGIFNIYNSLLAIAVCTDLGVKPCVVKAALSEVPVISGRYEIIKDEITVIIDYAHTDAAFDNILRNLMQAKRGNQGLTVVFGCGGERDRTKRPRMANIAEQYADEIYVTSDNSRGEDIEDIISDIITGFQDADYKIIKDREKAIHEAILNAKTGGIVAILGKGAEKYNIDKTGYHYFDEKEIIAKALAARRNIRV